mgnify:CR=1 FL=1
MGIFIPLIVTNCAIIGRAEAYASKNPVPQAAFDGLMMGLGFSAVLVALGAMRELLGYGSLFRGAELLFGDWAQILTLQVVTLDNPFLLAILAPGAFLGMGILIAFKNMLDDMLSKRQLARSGQTKATRARVTGTDI